MGKTATITINGKEHTIYKDDFGTTIDGWNIDQFLDQADEATVVWLAEHGMGVVQNNPEYFDDIAERIEMPRDIKSTMDNFKTEQNLSEVDDENN
jgi:hypothetical protein